MLNWGGWSNSSTGFYIIGNVHADGGVESCTLVSTQHYKWAQEDVSSISFEWWIECLKHWRQLFECQCCHALIRTMIHSHWSPGLFIWLGLQYELPWTEMFLHCRRHWQRVNMLHIALFSCQLAMDSASNRRCHSYCLSWFYLHPPNTSRNTSYPLKSAFEARNIRIYISISSHDHWTDAQIALVTTGCCCFPKWQTKVESHCIMSTVWCSNAVSRKQTAITTVQHSV
jgi:hypothetical protein